MNEPIDFQEMNLPSCEEVRKHPKNKMEGKANEKNGKVNGKSNSSVKRKRANGDVQRNPSKRSAKSDTNDSRVKYSRNDKSSPNTNGFSEHKELNGIETLEEISCDEEDSSSSSEVSFLKRSFDLKLPNKLRHILVFDHDMITYRQSMPTLPASKSVKVFFHQHFTLRIFCAKVFLQLFSYYSLALKYFGKKILAQNLLINC